MEHISDRISAFLSLETKSVTDVHADRQSIFPFRCLYCANKTLINLIITLNIIFIIILSIILSIILITGSVRGGVKLNPRVVWSSVLVAVD